MSPEWDKSRIFEDAGWTLVAILGYIASSAIGTAIAYCLGLGTRESSQLSEPIFTTPNVLRLIQTEPEAALIIAPVFGALAILMAVIIVTFVWESLAQLYDRWTLDEGDLNG